MRPLLDAVLRSAARLSAIADDLDRLRGRPLSSDERANRDRLLREQRETRSRFENAESRLRTLRSLIRA